MKKTISRISVWFPQRSYGFLFGDEESPSGYFLYDTDIVSGKPVKGAVVRFDALKRRKGLTAINAEVFSDYKEMERADALACAASLVALVDSAPPAVPTTDASVEGAK